MEVSRRGFIASAVTAGAGIINKEGNNNTGSDLLSTIKAQTKKRDKTIIKVVYLAKPVPTWPFPDFNPQDDMQKINVILQDFKKMWDFPVEFTGGELLRLPEHVDSIQGTVKDADGILLFNLTSGVAGIISPVAEFGIPTVLFSQPYSGHDWSIIGSLTKQGKKMDVIASSEFADIEPYARMFDTMRKLKQTKILCIRPGLEKSGLEKDLESVFNLQIQIMDYARLQQLYDAISTDRVHGEAQEFIKNAVKVVEPNQNEIINSFRLYNAIQQLLVEEGANAITIDCLGGFKRGSLPAYPCVAWTKLNDAGLTGVCESDVPTTVTQVLLGYFSGKPGYVSDPLVDTKTNTVIHAHCVSATKMDGEAGPSAPYIIRSHMEDNKGVSIQVKMRIGQMITLAKLSDARTMLLSTGEIIENPESHRGCRTKVTTKVADAEKFLYNYSGGLHRVLFYGNYVKDMKRMGKLLGIRVEEEI